MLNSLLLTLVLISAVLAQTLLPSPITAVSIPQNALHRWEIFHARVEFAYDATRAAAIQPGDYFEFTLSAQWVPNPLAPTVYDFFIVSNDNVELFHVTSSDQTNFRATATSAFSDYAVLSGIDGTFQVQFMNDDFNAPFGAHTLNLDSFTVPYTITVDYTLSKYRLAFHTVGTQVTAWLSTMLAGLPRPGLRYSRLDVVTNFEFQPTDKLWGLNETGYYNSQWVKDTTLGTPETADWTPDGSYTSSSVSEIRLDSDKMPNPGPAANALIQQPTGRYVEEGMPACFMIRGNYEGTDYTSMLICHQPGNGPEGLPNGFGAAAVTLELLVTSTSTTEVSTESTTESSTDIPTDILTDILPETTPSDLPTTDVLPVSTDVPTDIPTLPVNPTDLVPSTDLSTALPTSALPTLPIDPTVLPSTDVLPSTGLPTLSVDTSLPIDTSLPDTTVVPVPTDSSTDVPVTSSVEPSASVPIESVSVPIESASVPIESASVPIETVGTSSDTLSETSSASSDSGASSDTAPTPTETSSDSGAPTTDAGVSSDSTSVETSDSGASSAALTTPVTTAIDIPSSTADLSTDLPAPTDPATGPIILTDLFKQITDFFQRLIGARGGNGEEVNNGTDPGAIKDFNDQLEELGKGIADLTNRLTDGGSGGSGNGGSSNSGTDLTNITGPIRDSLQNLLDFLQGVINQIGGGINSGTNSGSGSNDGIDLRDLIERLQREVDALAGRVGGNGGAGNGGNTGAGGSGSGINGGNGGNGGSGGGSGFTGSGSGGSTGSGSAGSAGTGNSGSGAGAGTGPSTGAGDRVGAGSSSGNTGSSGSGSGSGAGAGSSNSGASNSGASGSGSGSASGSGSSGSGSGLGPEAGSGSGSSGSDSSGGLGADLGAPLQANSATTASTGILLALSFHPTNKFKMVKAVVAGAAGGIGQPLSLLLKLSPYVTELALYDVVNSPGVAADLSHISTKAKVTGYLPKDDGLKHALTGANIVVIPAGIPRKPGMTRDDLFKINAGIVRDLVTGVAQYAPDAFVLIISNPVNSTVPIAAEVLKKHNVFNPKKLFGVTTLDVVRAQTFTAAVVGESDPTKLNIPVVGGHSGDTIVPLLSLTKPKVEIPADKLDALVKRIQFGGDEVVQAKDGLGSATLSMAQAGFRFAEAVLKGAAGEKGVIEPAYIYLEGIEGASEIKREVGVAFFSVPVEFGPEGAAKAYNILPEANDYEKKLLKVSVEGLLGNVAKGEEFIVNPPPAK